MRNGDEAWGWGKGQPIAGGRCALEGRQDLVAVAGAQGQGGCPAREAMERASLSCRRLHAAPVSATPVTVAGVCPAASPRGPHLHRSPQEDTVAA